MPKRSMMQRLRDGLAAGRGYVRQTPGGVYAVALLLPVLALAAALWAGLAPTEILRDPIMVAGGDQSDFYLGLFSNLGVVLWTAAAAICLFAGSGLTGEASRRARHFLLFAGFFTLVLMLDDLFMLHENYADRMIYPLYALGLLYYVIRFFGLILRLDVVLFALAIPFFGNAIVIDLAPWRLLSDEGIELPHAGLASAAADPDAVRHVARELRYLLEDGFKFLGICCWTTFHIRAARLLRQPGAVTIGMA